MRKMLLLLAVAMAFGSTLAHGQTTATPYDPWVRVQQLKLGTTMHIKTTHGKVTCGFTSADADSLTCSKGIAVHLQKSEIRSISVSHRLRSTLVGFGVGGAAGALGGLAGARSGDTLGKELLSTVAGTTFALVGAGIGAATDFTHGTLYKQ